MIYWFSGVDALRDIGMGIYRIFEFMDSVILLGSSGTYHIPYTIYTFFEAREKEAI